MTENTRWHHRKVPRGAKIFAGLILVINLFVLAGLIFAMVSPQILEEIIQELPELGQDDITSLRSVLPFELAMVALTLFGLIMILSNKAWGFVPYAIPSVVGSARALASGDLQGALSSLAGMALMAVLLFAMKAKPLPAKPAQQSNYTYNTRNGAETGSDSHPSGPAE